LFLFPLLRCTAIVRIEIPTKFLHIGLYHVLLMLFFFGCFSLGFFGLFVSVEFFCIWGRCFAALSSALAVVGHGSSFCVVVLGERR
ncbi:hypothetical protein QBC35DRAFT_554063, partial [Podospora australis]